MLTGRANRFQPPPGGPSAAIETESIHSRDWRSGAIVVNMKGYDAGVVFNRPFFTSPANIINAYARYTLDN